MFLSQMFSQQKKKEIYIYIFIPLCACFLLFKDLAHYLPFRKKESFRLNQTVTQCDSLFVLQSTFAIYNSVCVGGVGGCVWEQNRGSKIV